MLKIMSMTAGDFSFDSVFAPSQESGDAEVMFVYSTVILWIIFLIIMPILFVNMLVSTTTMSGKHHCSIAVEPKLVIQSIEGLNPWLIGNI